MGYAVGQQLWAESIKAVPSLVVALLTLAVGWLVGNRLTAKWDERKKRRELDLQALGAFYAIYGQFFAIWKLWSGTSSKLPDHQEFRRDLLERAANAEGELESLLVRLAAEHNLSERECTLLGCFRQAFQCLRASIKEGTSLHTKAVHPSTGEPQTFPWISSEAPPYLAFKALSGHVADLLSKDSRSYTRPDQAYQALKQITTNRLERTWINETFDILQLHSPAWPR